MTVIINILFFSRGVRSIHWSEDISDGFCYMCVVHDKNISIWKVEGRHPKLTFKQVRKVNIQPILQGETILLDSLFISSASLNMKQKHCMALHCLEPFIITHPLS